MTSNNPLAREHITLLRQARSLTLNCDFTNGNSTVTCFLDDRLDIRVEFEIGCPQHRSHSTEGKVLKACWVLSSVKYNPSAATCFDMLRVGDILHPQFTVGNSSQALIDAGVHVDDVSLMIERPRTGVASDLGPKVFTFLVDYDVRTGNTWRNFTFQ